MDQFVLGTLVSLRASEAPIAVNYVQCIDGSLRTEIGEMTSDSTKRL